MTSAADGRVQWRVTARADGTHTFGMLVLYHELDGGGALRAFVRARGPLLAVTRDRDGVRATDLPVAAASPRVHVTPS